ncbi:hypothetical protein QBC39DRAFT_434709 [Podospora conica]|nr:hypothetical protein QBC39DRAFT_434709 [Schizothecium conicum]
MASFVISGVARGIGYEFLRQYSENPSNTVIGLVRNKAETDEKIAQDPDFKGRTNVHIFEADITNYNALKDAAAFAASVTGGSLDYLIANAGIVTMFDAFEPLGVLGEKPEELSRVMRELFEVNVLADIHLVNLFMPLILKGKAKKVILISSGLADREFTVEWDIDVGSLYSISKAAVNMAMAKFSAQYKKDGVLFLCQAPGMVEVGHYKNVSEAEMQGLSGLVAKFVQYEPCFAGPLTPEQSVTLMRSVIENASIEKGNGGDFLSQNGTKHWL